MPAPTRSSSNMLEAALGYVAEGFKVFPVKPDKKPLTEHGLKDATDTESGVTEFWKRWPKAGIGLVTDGLFVVDFDLKSGGIKSKADIEAKYGSLPRTRAHRTGGGGEHHIYRQPNGNGLRNTVSLAGHAGVDIRANGGYIIMPPSPHESGNRYEVLDDWEIQPAPEWLVTLATKEKQPAGAKLTGHLIPEGQRNATLASLGGTMRRRGMSHSAIEAALLEENRQQCQPPLPVGEVTAIAASMARYQPPNGSTTYTRGRCLPLRSGSERSVG